MPGVSDELDCVAARDGRQAELPGRRQRRLRKAREATLLIAETGGPTTLAVLLERRPAPGVWGGLWSPPQFDMSPLHSNGAGVKSATSNSREHMAPINHAFTHFDLRLNPLSVRCKPLSSVGDGNDRRWYV